MPWHAVYCSLVAKLLTADCDDASNAAPSSHHSVNTNVRQSSTTLRAGVEHSAQQGIVQRQHSGVYNHTPPNVQCVTMMTFQLRRVPSQGAVGESGFALPSVNLATNLLPRLDAAVKGLMPKLRSRTLLAGAGILLL